MPAKITKDVLESYLNCKYKGHLKLTGQQGTKSDYETLLIEMRAKVRLAAIDKILASRPVEEIPRNIPLTTSALKQGASFLLDATLDDDLVSITFVGLKKVDGPSKLGDFHYIPMIFHEGQKVRKEQKFLLELYGLLLSHLQGHMPVQGIIWHGKECKATRVRLNADLRRTERLFRDLKEICSAASPPKLILNDHCQVCEFRQRCHAQALQEDNLSLLRGLGEKEIKTYGKRGIVTLSQLAQTYRPRRKGKSAEVKDRHSHPLKALAIRDQKIYVFGNPQLPKSSVNVYFDIEGITEEGFVYLIGMIVVENESEKRYSFWADSEEQEGLIFDQFLTTISRYEMFTLFCYGGYERAFLQRMKSLSEKKELVDRLLKAMVHTLSLLYSNIYFPTYSNGLKGVGSYLGCSWSEQDASGIQSIVWRMKWEATLDDRWKQNLTTYNLEDCAALKRVTEFITGIPSTMDSSGKTPTAGHLPISQISELPSPFSRHDYGTPSFANADFQEINKCSYFDYQRDKVYLRTNKLLKRLCFKKKKQKKHLKAKEYTALSSTMCLHCGSSELDTVSKYKYRRVTLDLKVTAGGVRRIVSGAEANKYRCAKCSETFFPEQYTHMPRYGHSLKSWAIYEHVAHRTSFENIEESFRELFKLPVCFRHIQVFKAIMSGYYKATYDAILKKLISGKILLADETAVRVKKIGKGYVWVFTNLEEVIYIFKPTREWSFLHSTFKEFSGVLISDFYAAYDSLDCPQQKCLIHLIRDLNNDLISNPFDAEFKSLTSDFGQLLRSIIDTVDRYGLKCRHLMKHQKDVDKFIQSLSASSFSSEPAQTAQKRIIRYKDKLFTFLKSDGVPWNNNNAENAVKQFAHYRTIMDGKMTETGLNDYLVLQSIYQTCKRKGIGFLNLLLSQEVDLDKYSQNRPGVSRQAGIATLQPERAFFEKKLRKKHPTIDSQTSSQD